MVLNILHFSNPIDEDFGQRHFITSDPNGILMIKPHLLMVRFPPYNPIRPINLFHQNQSHQLMRESHF